MDNLPKSIQLQFLQILHALLATKTTADLDLVEDFVMEYLFESDCELPSDISLEEFTNNLDQLLSGIVDDIPNLAVILYPILSLLKQYPSDLYDKEEQFSVNTDISKKAKNKAESKVYEINRDTIINLTNPTILNFAIFVRNIPQRYINELTIKQQFECFGDIRQIIIYNEYVTIYYNHKQSRDRCLKSVVPFFNNRFVTVDLFIEVIQNSNVISKEELIEELQNIGSKVVNEAEPEHTFERQTPAIERFASNPMEQIITNKYDMDNKDKLSIVSDDNSKELASSNAIETNDNINKPTLQAYHNGAKSSGSLLLNNTPLNYASMKSSIMTKKSVDNINSPADTENCKISNNIHEGDINQKLSNKLSNNIVTIDNASNTQKIYTPSEHDKEEHLEIAPKKVETFGTIPCHQEEIPSRSLNKSPPTQNFVKTDTPPMTKIAPLYIQQNIKNLTRIPSNSIKDDTQNLIAPVNNIIVKSSSETDLKSSGPITSCKHETDNASTNDIVPLHVQASTNPPSIVDAETQTATTSDNGTRTSLFKRTKPFEYKQVPFLSPNELADIRIRAYNMSVQTTTKVNKLNKIKASLRQMKSQVLNMSGQEFNDKQLMNNIKSTIIGYERELTSNPLAPHIIRHELRSIRGMTEGRIKIPEYYNHYNGTQFKPWSHK
ncbi:hypothetical protein TBLA_0C03670 [Henningerozyma blattae CBS 6284]|uniref:RRM domain-containing protein n=1 Tax=Henningerozyma blattae (strain ATCC 34711 / CBS 6284 / DSM 70876 / NBRC 10599 / NRRL Y-10934 / UCD 77-7) TaxID=1071380 RepID=I2H1B8_HENB6|nr:hypothetical protein TBLA_0C03670 [Tetrapisispora blattae CBS 6284]CCH60170.1 hypothetical protein TBLA_0C03670 [Tetrapisispora blattae CBS 6284]